MPAPAHAPAVGGASSLAKGTLDGDNRLGERAADMSAAAAQRKPEPAAQERECFSAPLSALSPDMASEGLLYPSCGLAASYESCHRHISMDTAQAFPDAAPTRQAALPSVSGAGPSTLHHGARQHSLSACGTSQDTTPTPTPSTSQHWLLCDQRYGGDGSDWEEEERQAWHSATSSTSPASEMEPLEEEEGEEDRGNSGNWGIWDAPAALERELERLSAACTTGPACSSQEIRMVWPVSLSLGISAHTNARLSVFVDSADDSLASTPVQSGSQLLLQQGAAGTDASPSSTVLIMAGASMELVACVPFTAGLAHCTVPSSRAFSTPGSGLLLEQMQSSSAMPIRVLTLFATSASAGVSAAGGCDAGPAVNVLCGPPRVAEELNNLFCRIAADLLTLETDPSLTHVQLRDVHGFTYLPGASTSPASSFTEGSDSRRSGDAACAPCPHAGLAPAKLRARILQGLSDKHARLGSHKAQQQQPTVHLTSQELRVCRHAWAKHFQPLMQQVAYLLTCVPSAFAGQLDGISPAWDQHGYCKTLAGMIAYLEHYRCWHVLAGLLQHASTIGVAFRYQGECISRESLTGPMLEQLMQYALHDDISVQYLQQAPQRPFDWQVQREGLTNDFDWRDPVAQRRSDGGMRTPGGDTILHSCLDSVDDALQYLGADAAELQDALAGEFKDWEKRWLARGYSGTLISAMPPSPAPAAPPASVAAHGQGCWTGLVPWEVLVLLLSCIAIAMQYASHAYWGA